VLPKKRAANGVVSPLIPSGPFRATPFASFDASISDCVRSATGTCSVWPSGCSIVSVTVLPAFLRSSVRTWPWPKNSNWRPSIARIASPARSPAADAGEPGWTSKKRSPTKGVATQAISVKISG